MTAALLRWWTVPRLNSHSNFEPIQYWWEQYCKKKKRKETL